MELKGTFTAQVYEGEDMVSEHIAHNTVMTQGLEQIIRWLSRQQFPDEGDFSFGATRQVIGEKRQIYLGQNYDGWELNSSLNLSDWDNEKGFPLDFDTLYSDYNHLPRNHGTDTYLIQFKEPIDIIGLGLAMRGYGGYHDINIQGPAFYIRLNGFVTAGSGDSQYNKTYETRFVSHNDKYTYKSSSSEHYVYANPSGQYVISTSIDGASQYETTNSPKYPWDGIWTATGAPGPAPTFTKGTGINRTPIFTNVVNGSNGDLRVLESTERRYFNFTNYEPTFDSIYKSDPNWTGDGRVYKIFDFRGPQQLETSGDNGENPAVTLSEYGFLREVDTFYFYAYTNQGDGNGYQNIYPYRMDFYVPEMHPQNPYALKLGTDDGTILPLASGNMSLGAFSAGMEWKVDSVVQPSGTYKVRYTKEIPFQEGNDITFKEIGLFMNKDGHLPEEMSLPNIENANDIFSRAIFDTPWSKSESQHAVIYYELEVQ
jgi:hypothetical protein